MQPLPLLLGMAGLGAGAYYAKQAGYIDGLLGAPPAASKAIAKVWRAELARSQLRRCCF